MRLRDILLGLDALSRPLGQERPAETPLCRRLLVLWMRALNGVGLKLIDSVIAVRASAAGGPANGDLRMAVALLRRARLWLSALQRRLVGNGGVAMHRLDRIQPLDKIDAIQAVQCATPEEAPLGRPRKAAAMPGEETVGLETGGKLFAKPAVELMEGICADLLTAATLLGDTAVARYVAEIAEAARAMLSGYATEILAAWSDVLVAATGEPPAALEIAGPLAPDSG